MHLSELLPPERFCVNVHLNSKKHILEHLSEIFAHDVPTLTAKEVLTGLQERERLGTTGFGNGVAIPHTRLAQMESIAVAFIQLEHEVDYNALDERPVDLLFAMLVPEQANDEHVRVLSQLAGVLSDKKACQLLRSNKLAAEKYQLIENWIMEE